MNQLELKKQYSDIYKFEVESRMKYKLMKRIGNVILSLFLLLIVSPIILIAAICIRLESKGSVFFVQERVGLGGKVFKLVKLRSMVQDAEKNGVKWAEKNDPRVTKVGKFIRKTRIDELPQLINIVKGDMLLIGPRPELPLFTYEFEKKINGFSERLSVMPGITGWAQVNGGYDISPKEKLKFDLEYIEKQSFWLDVRIAFMTIRVMITGHGAR